MEFPARELQKFFKMGDHVKVIAGRYEGDTGLIVRIENNIAVIFSDLTLHEVCVHTCLHVYMHVYTCVDIHINIFLIQLKVRPHDLQLCSETSTRVDSTGQFQWGDLVTLE